MEIVEINILCCRWCFETWIYSREKLHKNVRKFPKSLIRKYARKQCRKKFVFANFLSELSTFQFNKVKTELMLNSITFRKEKTLETFLKTFLFSPRSWQFLHFFRKHETYPGVTWKLKLVLSFERSTTVLVSGILNRGMKELLFGFSEFEIISDWDNKILSTFLW